MSEFQFKSNVKTLDIKGPSGEVVKTYKINVGQKDQVKSWMKQLGALQSVDSTGFDEAVIDQLYNMEKEVVTAILGDWDTLWALCEENVFSMLSFVKYLSNFLTEQMQSFYKDYV